MTWASKYVGRPTGDRARGAIVDCWGLVMEVYREERGIELPSFEDQYEHSHSQKAWDLVEWGMHEWDMWKPTESPETFDLAVFARYQEPDHLGASHVGILCSADQFLHASRSRVQAPKLANPYWQRLLVGFWRYAP